MKATHTCYMHPNHLRVETNETTRAWNIGDGWHEKGALCVSPKSSSYSRLNKPGLPCLTKASGRRCSTHGGTDERRDDVPEYYGAPPSIDQP